jgi:hypothetical protein
MKKENIIDHALDLHYVAEALLEYIDDLPLDVVAILPAMPGIDRDYVNKVLHR